MAKKQNKASKRKAQQNAQKKKEQMMIAIAAVVVVVIAFLVFGGNPSGGDSLPAEINTATGYQMFQDGAFLLDVRTQPEWEEYHVDGATMVVLDELESRISEVPFDQEVIIICNSGNRSQVARDILLAAGHTQVTSIAGGIQGWMSAGHAVVSGP
ncbi:MAG: rhodanese-like domain-containing protein [Anaerolineae bacterium]|jgi:phage shock protein E|nr:rhodanese-like domain-containing protein [Anaerolineae bacterium]MBT7073763.1 rhodanese-like domain-containing protein [Anaerolineae bacterium]MBT7782085.1 rhodanese-like domain-containing protein [Anaerolineae bacterium]